MPLMARVVTDTNARRDEQRLTTDLHPCPIRAHQWQLLYRGQSAAQLADLHHQVLQVGRAHAGDP